MATVGDLAATNLPYRTDNAANTSGGTAGTNKLWLPLWSGEVINAYDQYNMFENMVTTKTLTGGFSYEFPITGTVDLNPAWEAGAELVGGADSTSKTFKVNLDSRPMAAHFETDNVDLLVTQWDYRSELARQSGLTLANTRDRQLAVALTAACALTPITDDPRGSNFTSNAFQAPWRVDTAADADPATASENGCLQLLAGIEDYLVKCQENDIPIGQVYCVVTPKVFQVIRALGIPRSTTTYAFNSTTGLQTGANTATGIANNFTNYPLFGGGSENGGLGAPLAVGMNMMTDSLDYMGVKIVKSNHLPKTNLNASATTKIGGSKYNLNASEIKLWGIIFQTEAVAGLSLMGMKVDTVQDVRRNTQFTVASMMKGTGVIRPELCRAVVGESGIDTRVKLGYSLNTGDYTSNTAGNLTSGFAAEYKNIGD